MHKRQFINPRTIVSDITMGLVVGIVHIPDSMASGILAAINPINAVYAAILSMPVGAFFASSVFISVQTTSACQ
jgi:MFS superfamily sulfate permease-like transporter